MSYATRPEYSTAKKYHVCDWCGGKIDPGERYAKWSWFDDGTATTVKSHLVCLDAANRTHYPEEAWFNRDQPKGCDCGFDRLCCGMRPSALTAKTLRESEAGIDLHREEKP